VGSIIEEEHTACIFRVEVSQVVKVAGYMKFEEKKVDDIPSVGKKERGFQACNWE
jgi:hypothetical protein